MKPPSRYHFQLAVIFFCGALGSFLFTVRAALAHAPVLAIACACAGAFLLFCAFIQSHDSRLAARRESSRRRRITL